MDIIVFRTFLSILDEGSFAAAARRMGISRSQCSKYVADLEADLGARLLTRTTRSLRATTVGQEYSQRIREVLRLLDAANEGVRAASGHPAGTLKIGSPIFYTLKVLQPHILRFMGEYPDIQLEIVLDDSTSDVVGDGFDAVIRIGYLEDSTLHARRVHEAAILLVASPDYVAAHGTPRDPADLLRHSTLHYTNLRGAETWPLRRGEDIIYQKINPVFASNNSEMLHSMAVNGKGIAMVPEVAVAEDLMTGRLVHLMPEYGIPDIPVNLVYPSNKLMTAAMRSFLDFFGQLKLR